MDIDSDGGYAIFQVGSTKLAAHSRVLAERSPVLAALVSRSPPTTIALPPCIAAPALASLLAYLHTGQYVAPSPDNPANAVFTRTWNGQEPSRSPPSPLFALPQQGITDAQSQRNKALGFSLPQLASTVASSTGLIELFALCSVYKIEDLKPLVAKDVLAVLSPSTSRDMLQKARECSLVVSPESGFNVITETVERYVRQKMGMDPEQLLNPPPDQLGGVNGGAEQAKREIKEIRRKRVKE